MIREVRTEAAPVPLRKKERIAYARRAPSYAKSRNGEMVEESAGVFEERSRHKAQRGVTGKEFDAADWTDAFTMKISIQRNSKQTKAVISLDAWNRVEGSVLPFGATWIE